MLSIADWTLGNNGKIGIEDSLESWYGCRTSGDAAMSVEMGREDAEVLWEVAFCRGPNRAWTVEEPCDVICRSKSFHLTSNTLVKRTR